MFKYILLASILGLAYSAPAVAPKSGAEEPVPVPIPSPSAASLAAAPIPALAPAPVPAPKALSLITEIKTPASTAKLAHLVAPVATPLAAPLISPISRIAYAAPILPQVSPYAYAYSPALGHLEIAAAPSSYSIEQHGYHITY